VAVPATITTLSAENGLPIVFNPSPTNTQLQSDLNSNGISALLTIQPGTTTLVIDHTAFTVSQGLQTLTQDSTHTVVFGPSGILLGTTATIAIPVVASPTTITSGGVEIPVMPAQPTVQFIDVPQPSAAPRSQVTVNGVVYPLPLQEDTAGATLLAIPQPSGPPIQFGAKELIVGTQTVSVPSNSQSTSFVGAGLSFGLGPASCKGNSMADSRGGGNNNDGGNGGRKKGGGGLIGGIFGAIGGAIRGAATGLAGIASTGAGILTKTGADLGSDFTKNVVPLIDNVATGMLLF
jgi:hypothetical protein